MPGDTIAAIATAPGQSAIAVVRVSGPAAFAVAAPLMLAPVASLPSHRVTRIRLIDPRSGSAIDEALCTIMRAPRSYTGEDTVEISCHGSPALTRMVLSALVGQGARVAEPGEFTRRAFLSGQIDLAQAESVALLIGARSERAVILAARGIAGVLSARLNELRNGILSVMATLEVALDFPDDAPPGDHQEIYKEISELGMKARELLATARCGHIAHAGLTMAIVGAPNAGKSSLFNALLGRDRAIVTAEAGTTRDVLESSIVLGGVEVRLLDTAGIGAPRDPIDAEGMRRSRDAIRESDAVIVVVDGSEDGEGSEAALLEELGSKARIVALSKSDLGYRVHSSAIAKAIPTSVKVDGGLDALIAELSAEVGRHTGVVSEESAVVASARQIALLETAVGAIGRAERALSCEPLEIGLIELQSALLAASALLGLEVGDSVLDTVFSRFCVGK